VRSWPLPRWPLAVKAGEKEKAVEGKIPEPEECEATEDVLIKALSLAKNLPKKLQE
jgi:acyl-CoA thioesterase 8